MRVGDRRKDSFDKRSIVLENHICRGEVADRDL